jgi:hypothetical protein
MSKSTSNDAVGEGAATLSVSVSLLLLLGIGSPMIDLSPRQYPNTLAGDRCIAVSFTRLALIVHIDKKSKSKERKTKEKEQKRE